MVPPKHSANSTLAPTITILQSIIERVAVYTQLVETFGNRPMLLATSWSGETTPQKLEKR